MILDMMSIIALISLCPQLASDQGSGFTGQNGKSKPFWVRIPDPAPKMFDLHLRLRTSPEPIIPVEHDGHYLIDHN
jgi:hypothetical protein